MSYSKEAVSDSASAIPTQAPQIMREESVIDPYARSNRPAPKEQIGQVNKGGDPVAEEATPLPVESVSVSPQVAALARKEQQFRKQSQQLKLQSAALEKEKAEIAEFKAMKLKLDSKDYSGLDGLVDYNEFSQYQINKLNSADPTQQRIDKLEGRVSDAEKSSRDNISKQFEAAVSERRLAVNSLVESNPAFARVKKAKAQEAVVQHILETWEHDSKELSVEDAAKEVEEILVERAKQWSSLLEEEKAAEPDGEKKQLPPLKQGLKTITNQVTSGDLKKPLKSFQHMNDSERWAEARRRAEEKLQKGK